MAIATDTSGRQLPAGPAPAAWSTGSERARAFARARRHSSVVRWLKVLLPIAAVAVLSSYVLSVQRSIRVGDGRLELGPVAFSSEFLTMHNPRYEGYGKDGSRYSVSARTAEQDVGQKGPIKLNAIDGKLVQANDAVTTLTATRGVFDSQSNELELFDAIDIKASDGMAARLTRAKVFMKESRIVSDEPVTVEMAAGTLKGNSMVLLQKTREVTFSGGVAARLKPQSRPAARPESPARPASASGLIGGSDAPVDVTAPTLTVDDAKKTALFSGDVRAEQDGSVLTSRELEVIYEAGTAADQGGGGAAVGPASGRVKRIVARDAVVLTRGSDRVTSDAAEFDTAGETSVLTGAVTFTSGPDRQAIADRADLDLKAETALLTGAVTVSQGRNVLKGRRLSVDRRNGTMQLSAPATPGLAAGRIASRFHQPEAKPARSQAAPDGDAGGWRFHTDPNAPIDITSDVLDVDDKARTATFHGDVLAVQADFSIRTVELVATYSGQAGVNLMQPTEAGAKAGPAQLQRVQARKKVVVTSKGDQSATGDWADFDVKANTVVLGGDVVLTQGRNVVRGPRLVIDMTTGLSRMETGRPAGAQTAGKAPPLADADAAATAPAKPARPDGNCGGRMCAVFYPKDARELAQRGLAGPLQGLRAKEPAEAAEGRPEPRQPEAASSWSSTTTPAGGPQ
ncbi:MAG: LPS export ABC transporter periplasmic protein LptC [Hyphomicrobiaceae bacterium]|nr:LPS export ABC transporter periplasmic protein LptC [Hyphomicrobiaceae bacterium]